MKTSQYPVWKRFVSIVLVILMLVPSMGMNAAAEELLEEEHEHHYDYVYTQEPDCTEHGFSVYTCACGDSLTEDIQEPLGHDWIQAAEENNGQVLYVCTRCAAQKTETVEAASEIAQAELLAEETEETAAAETVLTDEWIEEDALPGAEEPRIHEDAPEAEVLEAEEEAQTQAREIDPDTVSILAADGIFPEGAVLSVAKAETPVLQAGEDLSFHSGGEPEKNEEIIYDEAIPDGDGFLLVNARSADEEYSVTREVVASYSYEIHMTGADGEVLQPAEGQSVTLAFRLPEAEDESLDVRVLHYPADGAAEELPVRVEDGTVYAETTGFSTFVVVFSCYGRRFTLTSGHETTINEIMKRLLPELDPEDVLEVRSSNPDAVTVNPVGDYNFWDVYVNSWFTGSVTLTIMHAKGEYEITLNAQDAAKIPYKKQGYDYECTQYTRVSSLRDVTGVTMANGWYVLDDNVTFSEHRLTVLGDVNLILMDGCTLNCKYGIRTAVNADSRSGLTIYGQELGTGKLIATGGEKGQAGIGGNEDEDGGEVIIYGGQIEATGYDYGAGIGGGVGDTINESLARGNLRGFKMYGGELTATGGYNAAGIGGSSTGNINGPFEIHGGSVQAFISSRSHDLQSNAAAIGGGFHRPQGSQVRIYGGTVYAEGYNGAGIGGAYRGAGGDVLITGGYVFAAAMHGAGIGGGDHANGGHVVIRGGIVTAIGHGKGAGIGGGDAARGGTVDIYGGTVIAMGQDYREDSSKVWLSMGPKHPSNFGTAAIAMECLINFILRLFKDVKYGGAGIGGGDGGDGGTVNIYGGTVVASAGNDKCEAIGHGKKGDSSGNLWIYDAGLVAGGNSAETQVVHAAMSRQERANVFHQKYASVVPCGHDQLYYKTNDPTDDGTKHFCKDCLYAAEHRYDQNGVCKDCGYVRATDRKTYNIWVGSTQITDNNKDNADQGFTFDSRTNTLTLNDKLKPIPAGSGQSLNPGSAQIYADGVNLTIAGEGNIRVPDGQTALTYGIYVKNGTLTLSKTADLRVNGTNMGVYAPDGLMIEPLKLLMADGGTCAVGYGGTVKIDPRVAITTVNYKTDADIGAHTICSKDGSTAKHVEMMQGFRIIFDLNGGNGTIPSMDRLTILRPYIFPSTVPTRDGYLFEHWLIEERHFQPGQEFIRLGGEFGVDLKALAVWKEHHHAYQFQSWEWEGLTRAWANFKCSECGYVSTIPAGIAREVTKQPTCEEPGIRTYTAIIYRDLRYENKKEVSIPATGHDWDPGIVTKEATTEAPGERTYTCRNDSSHIFIETIPQLHKHDLRKVERVNPTCVKPGNTEYWICRGCGIWFSDAEGRNRIYSDSVVIPATGHVPSGNWNSTIIKPATCTEQGMASIQDYCKNCNQLMEPRYSSISPLGHRWSYWETTKEATDSEEGVETRTCERCKETQTRSIAKLEKHTLTKVERKEPDCTKPGSIAYYKCSGCGALFSDEAGNKQLQEKDIVIPARGHEVGTLTSRIVVKSTCTENGKLCMEMHCVVCGELLESGEIPIPALGHDWGNWTVTKAATETETGVETRVCAHDSSHIETRTIPCKTHVHDLRMTEARAASCTSAGNIACWTCSSCGKLFSDSEGRNEIRQQSITIPAKGHTPGEWTETVIKASSCAEQGIKHLEQCCTVCGKQLNARDEFTPALGHSWGAWITTRAATETSTGIQTRFCANDRTHTQTRVIPKLEHRHVMVWITAAAATCTEPGNINYCRCVGCGKAYSDAAGKNELTRSEIIIPAKGHTAEDFWNTAETVKKATCTETGLEKLELLCKDCGTILDTREEVIPALGHTWGEWIVTKPATEAEEGVEERTCYSDSSHVETRAIPKLAHTHRLTAVAEKAASCTEAGNIAYYRCTGCGLLFRDEAGTKQIEAEETVITPMGHSAKESWDEGEITRAPTCTESGSRRLTLHCETCGEILSTRDGVIPALGHEWGAWTVTTEATEEAEGIETRTCAHDGSHTETRAIPKLAHIHRLKAEAAVEPSCTEEGVRAFWICEGCGKLFSDAQGGAETGWDALTIPPLGHSAQSWWESETAAYPTCTAEGYDRLALRCSRCNEILSTRGRKTEALGHDWGEWVSTRAATEEEEGVETRSCLNDPTHTETRTVPKLPHTHKLTAVAARAETCTEAGNIAYWICEGCGKLFSDTQGRNEIQQQNTVIPASGHSPGEWTESVVKAPTCTEQGEKHLKQHCALCHAVLDTRDELIPALGHSWGAWVTTKPATEEETGVQMRSCANDPAHTETHVIPKLEHRHSLTMIDAVAATCTRGGNIAFYLCTGCGRTYADAAGTRELTSSDLVIPAKGHSAEDSWTHVETVKQATCTGTGLEELALYCRDCGELLSTRTKQIPAHGHSWGEWSTTKPATEAEEGTETRSCLYDASHVETRAIPKLQHRHVLNAVAEKTATCTEAGNTEYWKCSSCGLLFADEAGTKQIEEEDTVIAPFGHSAKESWDEGEITRDATCTEPGSRKLTLHCRICNEILSTRDGVIPALGHSWGEWTTTAEATEEAEGVETRICDRDSSHTETRAIPRLVHTHSLKAEAAIEASCTEEGRAAFWICEACGKLFTDEQGTAETTWDDLQIPPLGHSAQEAWTSEISSEPGCFIPGYKRLTLRCSRCGEILSTRGEKLPALGHDWGDWVTTKTASEDEEGSETRTCRKDPTHTETRAIPKLAHIHKLTAVAGKAETCTEAGSIPYWVCSGCGLLFADADGQTPIEEEETIIRPSGHTAGESWLEAGIAKQPDCETAGIRRLELRCSKCGELLSTRSERIPALGHTWNEPTYQWTDNLDAVIAERSCKNDESHIEQEISEDIEVLCLVPAACEEDGEDLYTARFKNEAFEAWTARKTEALGHSWGEWSITKEATESADGEMSRTCLRDPSHIQTALIPKTGHVHVLSKYEAKDPTCTEEGNKEYWVCDEGENPCGRIFSDAEGKNEVTIENYGSLIITPLGHRWKVESVEWTDDLYSAVFSFTCERDGSHTREVLGEVLEEPVLTPPSAKEDGKLTYTATAILDGTAYQATTDAVIERAKPAFKTHSLVLSGEIGVHFYMELPEIEGVDYSQSYMSFHVKDLERSADFDPEKMNAGKTYYRFTCYVPSIMMAQPITATFHYGEDQTVEQTYTIMQYIQEFEKRSDEFPAATQQVVKALADFGHYIQPFLSDVRGWKIGTDYVEMSEYFKQSYSEEELAAVGEAVAKQAIVRDPGDSQIRKVTYNLVLDSETAIRVYLKPKKGYTGEVTATLDGGTENAAVPESDGRYLITIPNISAHQLGDMHTINVTAGGSFTIEVSALSYIQSILTSDAYKADQNARNAMAALYEYYLAVAAANKR